VRRDHVQLTLMVASVTRSVGELRSEVASLPPGDAAYFAGALDAVEAQAAVVLRRLQKARKSH
jgi:hypothetical protein